MANSIIGTAPYQIPTNGNLGSIAFQSADGITVIASNITTANVRTANTTVKAVSYLALGV